VLHLNALPGISLLGTRWKTSATSCLRIHCWRRTFGKQLSNIFTVLSDPVSHSVMSVTITRYRMDMILPAFANCLRSLPNIHTLELCHVNQEMTTRLKEAFDGVTMPSIRTIVMPAIAHHILRSCPNVEDVTCTVGDGSQILGTIASNCPRVERISGTRPSRTMLKRRSSPQFSLEFCHLPPI
jgi:hypothetical protein